MMPEPVDQETEREASRPTGRSTGGPRGGRLERYAPFAAVSLLIVGFTVRVRDLAEFWLNPDEGIYYSTLTWSSSGAFWTEVLANAHPPAFYLLLRGLGYLTWDFVWLRGASVVLGVAAIWVFWLVGRELGGSGSRGAVAGVASAGLLALNPNAIVLSQVLRPYMAVVFLLSAALLALLRYRSAPSDRTLTAYGGLLTLAVLTHYSAVLAVGALSAVLAHDLLTRELVGAAARKLLVAHAIPGALFVALYLFHVRPALDSELMGEALGAGGWLSGWLVDSPRAAWHGLVTFQDFHLSPPFRVRAAFLLLAAVTVSLATRDRLVALLAGSAIAVALSVSTLGLYPFGESRHNAWLTVFTIPALGWLGGRLVTSGPRSATIASAAIVVLLVAGGPLERTLAGPERHPEVVEVTESGERRIESTRFEPLEERLIRRADIAALIVARMNPEEGPGTIVMTEQTYNVLMPLYAAEREHPSFSADSALFHFDYGSRDVVVVRSWDWSGVPELARHLDEIPDALPGLAWEGDSPVLVLAGGYGSRLLPRIPYLTRDGTVTDVMVALAPDGTTVRLAALVLDPTALADASAND